MKNIYSRLFIPAIFLFALLFSHHGAKAQTALPLPHFDEKTLRAKMKNDGVPQPLIDKFIAERILTEKRASAYQFNTSSQKNNILPIPFAACSDMGGEAGWGSWQADIGTAQSGSQTWTPPPGAPTAPNFNLTSGTGTDPCTPGPAPGAPTIPVVAPGFGNASLQIGQPQTTGCVAEQATYSLGPITAADTNFIFSYALVIQDAGHSVSDQPFVDLCIKDSGGNPVPCGCFRYTGGATPGFYQAACGFGTYYKPWTVVGVNLSNYIGQTLTITILNVDCAQCGHYAHSYWDFTCKPLSSSASSFCLGQAASICAPSDPAIAYTYQWYQNGSPYTGPPSATSQCITPIPAVGDTFAVAVIQPSGCNFYMTYVPTPMTVTPNFNFAINCGTVTFTDASVTSNGTPISTWNWSFPGGSPATSTSQNPTVTYPAGAFTATLIVTSQTGCTDTIVKPVNVNGLPTAAFSVNTVCAGNTTQFSDNSVAGVGDPLVSWNWSFPSGTPATATTQSPSVTYPPGNYTASLTITSQGGCTATITQPVTVNALPVPAFTGKNVCFNTLTTFTDMSTGNNTITNWNWNFGDGNSSTSPTGPTHTYGNTGTYSVTLTVTNNFGCIDSTVIMVVVNPLPTVNFTSAPVCFGDSTCFGDLSTIASGNITGWSWNFGDPNSGSNISNVQNPCHTFSGLGPYNVLLTVTSDSACQSTTQLPATINPPPVANFNSTSVCLNATTGFTDASTSAATDPVNVWDWDFGDGSPHSAMTNPSHVYTTAGNFTVTLIVTTQKGCKDTVDNPVTVYNLPVAIFINPDSGCSPVNQTFTDLSTSQDGNIATWQWSFPGGSPSASVGQSGGTSTWTTPGSYGVQLIVTTIYGCMDTLYMPNYINVFDWPKADFCVAPNKASVNDPVFGFCPQWSSDVTQWVWDFGDGSALDSVNTNPIHSYSAIATNNDFYTYNVCINVKNVHGCYDTICHTVELLPEFEFYIPNCVTPNGDGINDLFFGKSRGVKDYSIWIFDRWGNLIWDCHYEGKNVNWDDYNQDGMSSACKWDAKVEGGNSNQLVQEDVYVWKVRLTDIFDKKHNYIGHVSVVK